MLTDIPQPRDICLAFLRWEYNVLIRTQLFEDQSLHRYQFAIYTSQLMMYEQIMAYDIPRRINHLHPDVS